MFQDGAIFLLRADINFLTINTMPYMLKIFPALFLFHRIKKNDLFSNYFSRYIIFLTVSVVLYHRCFLFLAFVPS